MQEFLQFLTFLLVFVAGWGIAQFGLLYPHGIRSVWHPIYAITLAYYQMFGQLNADNVIRSQPFDFPKTEEDGWCTKNETEYHEYGRIRCPDTNTNWLVYLFLMLFILMTNLVLFNLLIAIFNYTMDCIQGIL